MEGEDETKNKDDGNQVVNYVRVLNQATGEITNVITGNAEEGARENYTDLSDGE